MSYRIEQTLLAILFAGLGLLKAYRLTVDAIDYALTLPRSTM